MKKLTLVAAILSLAGLSAFAQSSVLFSGTGSVTTRLIWDDWSTQAPRADASNNVAFLWATTGTPLVDSISTSTATNVNPFASSGALANAWTAILTDPNFHLATNGTTLVTTPTSTVGNYSYNANASFTLAGYGSNPSPTGSIIIYVIAWANTYANPFAAAAAGAAVGWSNPFTYTLGTPTSAAVAFNSATSLETLKFGVQTGPVPEPTTLALLGLGSAGLMIFRRRK